MKKVPCPCTTIEQDETCPVGYPSLLCEDCAGTGVVPWVKLDGPELWEIVFGIADGIASDITEEQYQKIADANHSASRQSRLFFRFFPQLVLRDTLPHLFLNFGEVVLTTDPSQDEVSLIKLFGHHDRSSQSPRYGREAVTVFKSEKATFQKTKPLGYHTWIWSHLLALPCKLSRHLKAGPMRLAPSTVQKTERASTVVKFRHFSLDAATSTLAEICEQSPHRTGSYITDKTLPPSQGPALMGGDA